MSEQPTGDDRAAYVIRAITTHRDAAVSASGDLLDYDVETIISELDLLHPDYAEIPQDTFWEVVEKHHHHQERQRA